MNLKLHISKKYTLSCLCVFTHKQDKALVENAVHLAYQRIYYPMREMAFFSLEDLNREIGILLERYNNLLFHRKESSRTELFQSVERQYLKPLPGTAYELKDYRRAKVQKMGYVYFSREHVLKCVENILASQDYPEVGYKRALGVIQLNRAYGSRRLNDACKRALDTDACSYNHIKNIKRAIQPRFCCSRSPSGGIV